MAPYWTIASSQEKFILGGKNIHKDAVFAGLAWFFDKNQVKLSPKEIILDFIL